MAEDQVMIDAVDHLVRGIVAHPDDVSVTLHHRGRRRSLDVRVNPDDRGRLIGRHGRTATALRTVTDALAEGDPVRVDITD